MVKRSGFCGFLHVVLLVALFAVGRSSMNVKSYQMNDIVSSHYQTVHAKWKTPWIELPINQMPKFGQNDAHVVRFTLPSNMTKNSVKIDPNYDVKVLFAFANHKLMSPLVVTFDAQNRKLLKKCTVTFMHDAYDIVRIRYDYEYGVQIRQLDPTHPSLSAVELIYVWDNSVQADDTSLGIVVLFILTVVFLIMLCFVTYNGVEGQSRSKTQHYSIGQASAGRPTVPGSGVPKSVRFNKD